MNDSLIQLAVSSPSLLGESPFWHPREHVLYYVDIPGRRLNRFDPHDGQLTHWDFATEIGSCAPMLSGEVLLAMRDGLWRFSCANGALTPLAAAPYDASRERFNDGKCDPQGRFWSATIYEPRDATAAALYCWDGHELVKRADQFTTGNGIAWSPDCRTMWVCDTKAHTVYAYDFDPVTCELTRRRAFASFPLKPAGPLPPDYGGRPDGAAVDAEGCYWVAMFEGARLLRLSPTGDVLREVKLPVRCPTMPCFGDADLRTLYITTSRENRSPAELAQCPWSGCVLSLRVDVPGLPVNLFH